LQIKTFLTAAIILILSACDFGEGLPNDVHAARICETSGEILSDQEIIESAVEMLLEGVTLSIERQRTATQGIILYEGVADFIARNPKCCRFSSDEFIDQYTNKRFFRFYLNHADKGFAYPVFLSYRFSEGQDFDYRSGYIFVGVCGPQAHSGGLRDEGATREFYDTSLFKFPPMMGANDAPSEYFSPNQSK